MIIDGFVYVTECLVNGKKYIGKCRYDRINDHRKYLGSGVLLKEDIKKFGKENFRRTVLAEVIGKDLLEEVEERFIREFNAVESPDYYNQKYSSVGGDTITFAVNREERAKAISKRVTGKNNPMAGRPKTQAFYDAIKLKNSRRVSCKGVEYASSTEAAEALGIIHTTIAYRCNSKSGRFPDYFYLDPPKKRDEATIVRASDHNGLSIEGVVYKTMQEAKTALQMNNTTVKKRLLSEEFPNWFYIMK